MPPEEDNSENFSAAFDALTDIGKEDPAPAVVVEEAAPAAEDPAPAAEAAPVVEESAVVDGPAPVDEEPSRVAPEAPAPDKADDDALLARLAKLVKEEPAPAPPSSAPAAAPEAVYSEEEQQVLTDYEKDWPEVARAESLRRRAEYRDLVTHIFSEVAKEVAPALDLVRSLAQRSHLSDLQEVVTDYEDVRDKVVDWVETQPAYLQQGMKHVIAAGTVEEVADLIERFKSATGTSLASAAPAAAPAAPSKETKAAAASLAPVSGKRSVVPKTEDNNNFEDAFERFASAGQ